MSRAPFAAETLHHEQRSVCTISSGHDAPRPAVSMHHLPRRIHPDFSATMLDDNGAVIFMNDDRLLCYLRPEDTVVENGKLSGKTMFSARENILEACMKKQIIAIVRGY